MMLLGNRVNGRIQGACPLWGGGYDTMKGASGKVL